MHVLKASGRELQIGRAEKEKDLLTDKRLGNVQFVFQFYAVNKF